MSAITADEVVSKLGKKLAVRFQLMPRKQIFYAGLYKGKTIVICTPFSKIHDQGNGWIDFGRTQISTFDEAKVGIVVFRLDDGRTYYFLFNDLKPYLTEKAMTYNNVEGDHWKMYVWDDYIDVLGSGKKFYVNANNEQEFVAKLKESVLSLL